MTSKLQAFFADKAAVNEVEKAVISDRFKDSEGKSIPFELRYLTEEEAAEIRKESTKITKGRGAVKAHEFDNEKYMEKMAARSVVFPDLKNAELQKSYGVRGDGELLKKMLLAGEFSVLFEKINQMNGFDRDVNDLKDEAKN